ncbi:MAG: macrolide ABC transporter ATP-binding protein [Epsilonproteobacteria bacterium (ex Lamellibrachia satsuma)]|nr:MAG: macrolide ABC transporter ATP-binding protein [Epsilonproteobacteria bacterium (ex Lamellibrachia satsuma)]
MIKLAGITKTYGRGEVATQVLKGIDLQIEKGEFVAIMGPSGSGKSTLLNILGALDVPSAGDYYFMDTNIRGLSKDQLALFRRNILGFVFQGFNLLKKTSAQENVEMPLIYQGVSAKKRHKRAIEALTSVGLQERVDYDSGQLSGGEQQRVAIARAIVTRPKVLIADEPTGNLDTKRSHEIMQLISGFNREGITVVMVTHEEEMAEYASRIIRLRDGMIEKDGHHAS